MTYRLMVNGEEIAQFSSLRDALTELDKVVQDRKIKYQNTAIERWEPGNYCRWINIDSRRGTI